VAQELKDQVKRWAILTILLYGALLFLLSTPLVVVCSYKWHGDLPGGWRADVPLREAIDIYKEWGFWLWLGVLVAAQGLLLLVPLDLREKRLKPRVNILVPFAISGFLLANLCFAGLLSLLVGLFDERGWEAYGSLSDLIFQNEAAKQALTATGLSGISKDWQSVLLSLQILGVFWLAWGFIFYRYAKSDSPEALVSRITRWLLRGSILDLLIAVPSHVIVRSRTNCCAPIGSFWGIATGISVMLLAFGPGVFFLFVKRMNRLKPKVDATPQPPTVKPAG
jgi:hypothetical protein